METPTYVAVKILVASQTEESCHELHMTNKLKSEGMMNEPSGQHLCLPLKHFMSESPSGTHICFVYPVLGPEVKNAREVYYGEKNRVEILQNISRQVVEGLISLHNRGICHGGTSVIGARLCESNNDAWQIFDL